MKKFKIVAGIAAALFFCYFRLYAGTDYIESLKFKDTDIRMVLQAIADEARNEGENINIMATPDIEGLVTINLKNIDWRSALKVILKTYNYNYTQRGDVITVSGSQGPFVQGGLKMELFKFKYMYADVAKKLISPILSSDGKVSVLDIPEDKIYSSQTTIDSGTSSSGSASDTTSSLSGINAYSTPSHSKILIVYDTADKLDLISTLLSELDVMPKQVLIQAIIMEVNRDTLRDIGIEWGTGNSGVTSTNPTGVDAGIDKTLAGRSTSGNAGASPFTPNAFNPLEGTTSFPGTYPYKAGLDVVFQRLAGTDFEVMMHALEEDARTNTLSKPIILTTNNQLASILIGTKFPIIETQTSSENSYIVGGSLQQYMDIGVQLKVKPQICGSNEEYINLLLHPIVSSYTQTSKVTTQAGVTLVEYPIINTREAETQMVVKDGETIVMGGLLKDVKTNEDIGIPFLSKIPVLGLLFKRNTKDNSKIDLMIFITAKIVKPGEVLPQEVLNTQAIQKHFKDEQVNKNRAKQNFNNK